MTDYAPPFRRRLLFFILIIAVLLGIFYGLFEARRLIEGPVISISAPRDGAMVAGPTITVTGSAQNAAFLTINSAQAYVDEHDTFAETLSPPPGYTVVTVTATDRFGRVAQKSVHITVVNYCPIDA